MWFLLRLATVAGLLSKPNTSYLVTPLGVAVLGGRQGAWKQCVITLAAVAALASGALLYVHITLWPMLRRYACLPGEAGAAAVRGRNFFALYATTSWSLATPEMHACRRRSSGRAGAPSKPG